MKRKKIYYVPGIISLLGISFLFYFWVPKSNFPATSIRLFLPSDRKDDFQTIGFSKGYFYKSIKGKKIIRIDLNEEYQPQESSLFQAKLNFISREIERLEFTNDTTTILRIDLGERNTYGHFIWVLNQALTYKLRRYTFVDDSFYLLANPRPARTVPDI
jgi:hypothetical protein